MQLASMRSLRHHGPDKINDAILAALPIKGGMSFKDLADAVMLRVFPKKPTYQSLEKLRLRIYEQLQELVKRGQVARSGGGAG